MPTRRKFIRTTSLTALSPFVLRASSNNPLSGTLKACLNPSAIGLQCNAKSLLNYAKTFGFKAISPLLNDLLSLSETEKLNYLSEMKDLGIVFDSAGLPIQFRTTESEFLQGLKYLQTNIEAIANLKIPSFATWVMPTHPSLTYLKNFELHRNRLQQVAQVLDSEGLRLGLEYVGPKTLMVRNKYSFLHTISGLRELIDAIKSDNVGYLLDSFHTYCSKDEKEDLDFLELKDIVTVQINDGVSGRSPETQLDQERELPGDSGLINLRSFLSLVKSKGYTGPVSVEPFNRSINQMEALPKLNRVRKSLQQFGI